jgi:4-hydroxyphenylpyruvate dioxygenase
LSHHCSQPLIAPAGGLLAVFWLWNQLLEEANMCQSSGKDIDVSSVSSIDGIHHVEIYVSNNCQAAHFYRSTLGFGTLGARTEPRGSESTSLAMRCGEIILILTSPLTPSSPVANHIRLHGEGVKDIALSVTNLGDVFDTAVDAGMRPLLDPTTHEDHRGILRAARIATCGDLVHSLIDRSQYSGLLPGFDPLDDFGVPHTGLCRIDHVALALPEGQLDQMVECYTSALGFHETHQEQVSTEHSAMRSKVVESQNGAVRFPMMEPAKGKRQSQIENYIRSHQGSGAQHVAFLSHDIVKSVSSLAMAGIHFLSTPIAYYDGLEDRVGKLPMELDSLRQLGILVDRDKRGLLFQIFTQPIETRPTLFLEIIERRGADGFGSGNIKALFDAVERAQVAAAQ